MILCELCAPSGELRMYFTTERTEDTEMIGSDGTKNRRVGQPELPCKPHRILFPSSGEGREIE